MLEKKEFWHPVAIWVGLGIAGFFFTGLLLFALSTNRGLNVSPRSSFFWIGLAIPDLFVEAFGVSALIWSWKLRRRARIVIGALFGMFSPLVLFVILLVLKSITRASAIDDLAWILVTGFWSMIISGLAGGAYAAHCYAKLPSEPIVSIPPRHSLARR